MIEHAAIQQKFVDDLAGLAARTNAPDLQPLEASSQPPLPHKLRVYTYNATNPQGGRSRLEHKIQLIIPGQVRGTTGDFDHSGDRAVVLAGYADDADVWILWDASKHHDFGYSKNAQVPTEVVLKAAALQSVEFHERTLGSGETEVILVAPPSRLVEAVDRRFEAAPGAAPPSGSPGPHPGPPAGVVLAPPSRPRRLLNNGDLGCPGRSVGRGSGDGRTETAGVKGCELAALVGVEPVERSLVASPGPLQARVQVPLWWSRPRLTRRRRLMAATRVARPCWLRSMPR